MKLFGETLIENAWDSLFDSVRAAGKEVFEDPNLQMLDRIEGLRHITRLLRFQLEQELEAGNRDFPIFFYPADLTKKSGYDCPDYVYQMANIRGTNTYRIRGVLGDSDMLTFLTFGAPEEAPGDVERSAFVVTGVLETPDIDADEDGRFEVLVSKERQLKNWLPMSWRTCEIQVRDVVHDRRTQRPTLLSIERVDSASKPEALSGRRFVERLEAVSKSMFWWLKRDPAFTARLRETARNSFELYRPDQGQGGAYPHQIYVYGYWELKPDEALVIETEIPACRYWNFHICNYWAESLDYMHGSVNLNGHTAHFERDGRLRIVIAHDDPGVPNWIDPAGHRQGTMVFRFLHPQGTSPQPSTNVVKLSDFRGRA